MQRRVGLFAHAGRDGVGQWLREEAIRLNNAVKGWVVGVVERDGAGSCFRQHSQQPLQYQVLRPMHSSGTPCASEPSSSASSSQLPAPGAPLKKATQHDMVIGGLLQRGTSPKTPTHQSVFHAPDQNPEESAKRKMALKKTLEKYRKDLMRGKNGRDNVPSPHALPFLEDTITHLVGREQSMLQLNHNKDGSIHSRGDVQMGLRDGKGSPSRVRAMAMAEALRGGGYYGAFGLAEAGLADTGTAKDIWSHLTPQHRLQQSYIQKANAIIGIISAVEARVALTRDEKMAVARAAADHLQNSEGEVGGGTGRETDGMRMKTMPKPDDVLDCLQLLDLPVEAIARIISTYPSILFLDVDTHMLPILAYLSDLGLDDAEMGEVVSSHPSIFKPTNELALQSGVAFWTGKGLSRTSIVNLIKLDPSILETNKLVMQMKVDWLTEHTGLTVEELAAEPRTLSANLGGVTAPRISWLIKSNKMHVGDFDAGVLSNIMGDEHFERTDRFLEHFGGEASSYESFVGEWYQSEFVPWLEKKSRMSEILLQQESDMVELAGEDGGDDASSVAMQAFAAGKEFAWEQQMEREREWHMAWHAWKREQQSMALAERTVKRHQHRDGLSGAAAAAASTANGVDANVGIGTGIKTDIHSPTRDWGVESSPTSALEAPTLTTTVPGADAGWTTCANASHPSTTAGTLQSANAHQGRSIFFLSRKWTCDATIDEALSQAIADCEQVPDLGSNSSHAAIPVESFDPDILTTLSVERVQSCAVNLLLLLRASEYGTLEPKVFNAWASRSGVAVPELTAAKAIISSQGAAYVRSEPSWKYHAVPQKVWRLRDTAFYAPGLLPLRDTRGSRAVADLAELILKSLKQNPRSGPMTRMEISDMHDNKPEFQSKRMRFAIGLLLEQGMVIQRRRRGIASGPMELVLTETFIPNSIYC